MTYFRAWELKDNAVPVVNPPRRVPEALKSRLKELDMMESDQILRKVTEPKDWVNSLVVVEKPKYGKPRICLDPKASNEVIHRSHYPMSSLPNVYHKLVLCRVAALKSGPVNRP